MRIPASNAYARVEDVRRAVSLIGDGNFEDVFTTLRVIVYYFASMKSLLSFRY